MRAAGAFMANSILQNILRKLRVSRCAIGDFVETLPRDYFLTELDPAGIALGYVRTLMGWGLVEAYRKEGKRLHKLDSLDYDLVSSEDVLFYLSKQAIDLEKELGVSLTDSFTPLF